MGGYAVSLKGTSLVVGGPGTGMGRDVKGAVFRYSYDSLASSWNPVGRTQLEYACEESYFVRLLDAEELLVVCGEYFSGFSTAFHYETPEVGDIYVLKHSIRFENHVGSLAVDRNTMVVGEWRVRRFFAIHFLVQESDVWEEVATIDEFTLGARFGRAVALSGNITLVASERNVYQITLL